MEFFDNLMTEKILDDRISSLIKNIDRDIFYYRFCRKRTFCIQLFKSNERK